MYWSILLLVLPALGIQIDSFAGVRSRNIGYVFGTKRSEDFRVLVPIWGDMAYMTNADALHSFLWGQGHPVHHW